ncbi:MAG: hypothetical protein H7Y31_08995, partial [Chitinophagaceae bacterium]|nr:hypothetical protein [Chitinophagaceae bacterium]
WGSQGSFSTENNASNYLLYEGNDGHGDDLGGSMSISGNYLLVGARVDHGGSFGPVNGGTVRIYRKELNTWSDKVWYPLKAPSPMLHESFGTSVWIEGSNFIVGGPGANSSKGRAYIYTFGAAFGFPELNATLQLADEIAGDAFGTSVSISGNFAVVGAPYRDVSGKIALGRASTFQRHPITGIWGIMHHLTAPDGEVTDLFGKRVTISGNMLAVSAPQADINGVSNSGRVYIYTRNANTWTMTDSITAPVNKPNQKFGETLMMKGDTLIVGATEYALTDTDGTGTVYVYLRNGTNWDLQGVINSSDGKIADEFGKSVHLNNGSLIVGAFGASRSHLFRAGKAYIYKLSGNLWTEQAILAASQPTENDFFGSSVAIADSMAVVGAPRAPVLQNINNGRVYFFHK